MSSRTLLALVAALAACSSETESDPSRRDGFTLRKQFESRFPDISMVLVVTDSSPPTPEGQATRILRTYERISGRGFDGEWTASSPLEGATVRFDRAPGEGTWEASSEDVDGDLLAGLRAELDLAWLAPRDAVEEGDRWEIEAGDIADPFEGIPLEWDHGEDAEKLDRARELFGDLVPESEVVPPEGRLVATHAGAVEGSGGDAIRIELEGEFDLGPAPSPESEGLRTTMTMKGEALWNVEDGHLRRLDLEYVMPSQGEGDPLGTSTVRFEPVE